MMKMDNIIIPLVVIWMLVTGVDAVLSIVYMLKHWPEKKRKFFPQSNPKHPEHQLFINRVIENERRRGEISTTRISWEEAYKKPFPIPYEGQK